MYIYEVRACEVAVGLGAFDVFYAETEVVGFVGVYGVVYP
jgi:hypothetical protein